MLAASRHLARPLHRIEMLTLPMFGLVGMPIASGTRWKPASSTWCFSASATAFLLFGMSAALRPGREPELQRSGVTLAQSPAHHPLLMGALA